MGKQQGSAGRAETADRQDGANVTAAGTVRRLPRGRHRMTRDEVLASQRGRMLKAMADLVAEQGYASTTVADVIARAGVSRRTFYEHFADKRDCFFCAWDTSVRVLVDDIVQAAGSARDWRERLEAGLDVYLHSLVREPGIARSLTVDALAAGPGAVERRREVHDRFVGLLRVLLAEAHGVSPVTLGAAEPLLVAVVGGLNELAAREVEQGRTASLERLKPAMLALCLSVFEAPELPVAA
jgi:AcrR family transcriptional regulator